jgi:hypothetical protein
MLLEQGANSAPVQSSVALSAWCPDCWTLAPIQHPELQRRKIGRSAHYTPEGIDLTNHGALCNPSNRGVAGHLANRLQRTGHQADSHTEAGSCHCGFSTGVTTANHDYAELVFD